jgi:hypothetical protein
VNDSDISTASSYWPRLSERQQHFKIVSSLISKMNDLPSKARGCLDIFSMVIDKQDATRRDTKETNYRLEVFNRWLRHAHSVGSEDSLGKTLH